MGPNIRNDRRTGRHQIDLFPVLSQSRDESIVGMDDRHLDCRASVLLRRGQSTEPAVLIATTIVHWRSCIGRIYLVVIKPFHVLIVRSDLGRVARKAWSKPDGDTPTAS